MSLDHRILGLPGTIALTYVGAGFKPARTGAEAGRSMKAEWKTLVERFPAQEVSGAGRRFSYRRAGRGPDLVLLHGIGSGSASWVHQLAHFQDRHRVTAWDAPGYGGSDPLERAEPAATDYARALGAFLGALAIDRW